jgi:RNA polymerase sigma-70 factor (ECF subfamily)
MVFPHATSDAQLGALMRAAQNGDTRAYARLLGEITPRLRRFVRRRRGFLDEADAEDIVQEILLSLHAVRATYDPKRPFMPWFVTIAKNRLADAARRQMRRAAHEEPVDQLPVTFSDDAANFTMEEFGDAEELHKAVSRLPAGQRKAIELLKLREMSLQEASAVSGMTVAALKVSSHRAIGVLRNALRKA